MNTTKNIGTGMSFIKESPRDIRERSEQASLHESVVGEAEEDPTELLRLLEQTRREDPSNFNSYRTAIVRRLNESPEDYVARRARLEVEWGFV